MEARDAVNQHVADEHQVVQKVEKQLFELYKNPDLNVKPKELEQRGGAYYSDAACEVI
ncbi:family 4 glycosyl hydrolase, partial [Klebsiella pneumoniae]|uniref:family 4 glycosyl hydrolase n=1 Tax=Klebsiella pneumoniae TaxID=573 RepID=UPI0035AE5D46